MMELTKPPKRAVNQDDDPLSGGGGGGEEDEEEAGGIANMRVVNASKVRGEILTLCARTSCCCIIFFFSLGLTLKTFPTSL